MLNSRNILLFFIVLMFSISYVNAFDVNLKQWTFNDPDKKHLPMFVANVSDKPMALQIKIYTREFNEEGEEYLTGIYPGVEVLPANVIVGSKSKELVTLLWTGEMPEQEIPLRIVVTQLPIIFGNDDSSSLNVMFESVKTLYIKPPNSKPDIKLLSYEWDKDIQILSVLVKNQGTASLYSDYWQIKINDRLVNVYSYNDAKDELFGYTPQVNLLAGEVRRIPIKIISKNPLLSIDKVQLIEVHKE